MSDTDKKSGKDCEDEYTTSIRTFPDSIGIAKSATTEDLKWAKIEASRYNFHSGIVSQYRVKKCN